MPITALPTPPSRDDPANFAARGDAFLGALPGFVTEANALAADVSADEAAAAVSAAAALGSQNAAATSASNASLHKTGAQAAQAAAEAAAIAAGAGAGIPGATGNDRRVLRVSDGVASWQWSRGVPVRFHGASGAHNRLGRTSAVGTLSPWIVGAGVLAASQGFGGPNGLGFSSVTLSTSVDAFVNQSYTPINGQQFTLSVWWRGSSKPASGYLMLAQYLNAGGVLTLAELLWSDPSIIADGKWRRYSLTWTHANANVTARSCGFLFGSPAGVYSLADPQLTESSGPVEFVGAGPATLIDSGATVHVDSSGGSVVVLPSNSPAVGDWYAVKDAGRAVNTYPIVCSRNTKLIEGDADDLTIDIAGAALDLVYETQKGWVIR